MVGELLIADCEELEDLSASDFHIKMFKHQEVAQEGKQLFPCADGSLKPHAAKCLPRETLSKILKKNRIFFFVKEDGG